MSLTLVKPTQIILIIILGGLVLGDEKYKYENWKFHFLPGSGMGVFMALAVPVDLPNKNLYLAYNFEANYMLPANESHYEYPPLIQRRVDRQLVYHAIESKMKLSGFPGKACLLRTICEAASSTVQHVNGVVGDIIHIILMPSTSRNIDLSPEYENAEETGHATNDCSAYNKNCTVSFLSLISWLEKVNPNETDDGAPSKRVPPTKGVPTYETQRIFIYLLSIYVLLSRP